MPLDTLKCMAGINFYIRETFGPLTRKANVLIFLNKFCDKGSGLLRAEPYFNSMEYQCKWGYPSF